MKLKSTLAAVALAGAFAAGPVLAEGTIYSDLSGSEIVALLDSRGYQATLTTDQSGDPLIMAAADGLKFRVQTYNCNAQAPRRCESLQFVSSFSLQHQATEQDFIAMNDFNKKKIYGRAFIDENGDASIDMVVNLAGGVMAANLMDQVGTWKSYVLDTFIQHLGWKVS